VKPEESETLSRRRLNRATLARQGLLNRLELPLPKAASKLASLQAQHPEWPAVAAWSRVAGLKRGEFEAAIAERKLVRASLMRITIHAVAAADFWAMSNVTLPARQEQFRLFYKEAATDAGLMRKLKRGHQAALAALEERPRTAAEIRGVMEGALGSKTIARDQRYLWRHFAAIVPLVDVPDGDGVMRYGRSLYAAAEKWLGPRPESDPADDVSLLLERYLAAYGPASTDDMLMWTGQRIGILRPGLERLGDRVVRYRDETGRELLDLAGAPLPVEGVRAPCRFLARWDALLLSHATGQRERIIEARHKPWVYTKNGDVRPTFTVDGFVAGTWDVTDNKAEAVLRLSPFSRLANAVRAELEAEGERLLRFLRPEAGRYSVTG
jgi:hypothetical protein